jgi:hypothetical protein
MYVESQSPYPATASGHHRSNERNPVPCSQQGKGMERWTCSISLPGGSRCFLAVSGSDSLTRVLVTAALCGMVWSRNVVVTSCCLSLNGETNASCPIHISRLHGPRPMIDVYARPWQTHLGRCPFRLSQSRSVLSDRHLHDKKGSTFSILHAM